MSGALKKSKQATLPGFGNATSLPASAAGASASASPGGQTKDQSGQAVAPAKVSVPQGKVLQKKTLATSGQNSKGLFQDADQKSSSESKSPAKRDADGYLVKVMTCLKCGIEKPYSEFYVNSKGGRRKTCKCCVAKQERARKVKRGASVIPLPVKAQAQRPRARRGRKINGHQRQGE